MTNHLQSQTRPNTSQHLEADPPACQAARPEKRVQPTGYGKQDCGHCGQRYHVPDSHD